MPHVFEPAATGRSKCRGCKQPLGKGELRFGEGLPNPFGEGEVTPLVPPVLRRVQAPGRSPGRAGGGGHRRGSRIARAHRACEPRGPSPAAHRRRRARAHGAGQVPPLPRAHREGRLARAPRFPRGGQLLARGLSSPCMPTGLLRNRRHPGAVAAFQSRPAGGGARSPARGVRLAAVARLSCRVASRTPAAGLLS